MEKIAGIRKGFYFDIDDLSPYKKVKLSLGQSDIAQLTLLGFVKGTGAVPQPLHFGGDGAYKAYVVEDQNVVPEHYKLAAEYHTWLKIYDDTELVVDIDIRPGCPIMVYRAGEYGCIICIDRNNCER